MMSPVCRKERRDMQWFYQIVRRFLLSGMLLLAVMLLVFPGMGVSATVNYAANFKDVIGNAPGLDGPISIGGTNNLASHSDNIYSYGNTVNINGGIVDFAIYGGYYNGTLPGIDVASNNNAVTVYSAFVGSSSNDIYGGYAKNINPGSMTASGNTVSIYGGTLRNVYSGFANVASTTGTGIATASGNTANISGGTVSAVYGGYA